MTDHMPDDLSAAGRDLRAYTDELRPAHPVVRNVAGEWVLLRHDLVVSAAEDDVTFSSAGSSDPDNDALTYSWDFGDSTSSTVPNPTHQYTGSPRTVIARLTVTDNGSPNLADTSIDIPIVIGTSPPVATIVSPTANSMYNAGQTINYSGTGVDPEDGSRPASAFTWTVLFHHDAHTHPVLGPLTGVRSGAFTIPRTGHPEHSVFYRIYLTVRDSSGLQTQVTTAPVASAPAAFATAMSASIFR